MTTLHLDKLEIHTYGELPAIGDMAPSFTLCDTSLNTVTLEDFTGKPILLNVYPSIDTSVCFDSVKKFNEVAGDNWVTACISMDLPFALSRVLKGESLGNIHFLSDFRNRDFGDRYGLTIADGPVAGLLARAVILLDENHKIIYHQLVDDVSKPVDYAAVISHL